MSRSSDGPRLSIRAIEVGSEPFEQVKTVRRVALTSSDRPVAHPGTSPHDVHGDVLGLFYGGELVATGGLATYATVDAYKDLQHWSVGKLPVGVIHSVAVRLDWRGMNLAPVLAQNLAAFAVGRGCESVGLTAIARNRPVWQSMSGSPWVEGEPYARTGDGATVWPCVADRAAVMEYVQGHVERPRQAEVMADAPRALALEWRQALTA